MILNCAIIDEDPEALALLKHYVDELVMQLRKKVLME